MKNSTDQQDHKLSQKEIILRFMKQGRRITPMKALQIAGSMNLAQRIADLRKDGHDQNIKVRDIKTPSGKYVAEYWWEE